MAEGVRVGVGMAHLDPKNTAPGEQAGAVYRGTHPKTPGEDRVGHQVLPMLPMLLVECVITPPQGTTSPAALFTVRLKVVVGAEK